MAGELQPDLPDIAIDFLWHVHIPDEGTEKTTQEQYAASSKYLEAREALYKYGVPKLQIPSEGFETEPYILDVEKDVLDIERVVGSKVTIQEGDRLLDVGSGNGSFLWYLYQKNKDLYQSERLMDPSLGGQLIGIDPNSNPLAKIRQAIRTDHAPITYMNASSEKIPWGDDTFDKTFCNFVLYHTQDPIGSLLEIKRVTKPGGTVVVSTRGENNQQKIWALADIQTFLLAKTKPKYDGIELPYHWYERFNIDMAKVLLPNMGFEQIDEVQQVGELHIPSESWREVRSAVLSIVRSVKGNSVEDPVPTRREMREIFNKKIKPLIEHEVYIREQRGGNPYILDRVEQWSGIYINKK